MATVLEERKILLPRVRYNIYQLVHKYSLGGKYHVFASSSDPSVRPQEIFTGSVSAKQNWDITDLNIRYLNDLNKDGFTSYSLEKIKSDEFRDIARLFQGAIVPYFAPWSRKNHITFDFDDGISKASFDDDIIRIRFSSGSNYEFRDMMFSTYFFVYWKLYLWYHFQNGPHAGTNVFRLYYESQQLHFLEFIEKWGIQYGLMKKDIENDYFNRYRF